MSQRNDKDKKKKRKDKSILEAELMALMQHCLKEAIDAALDDIFREWK